MSLTITEDAGYYLRVWRAERGWKMHQAAKRLGVSPSHLSLLEAGRRKPSPKVAQVLAQRTGASLELLLGLEPPQIRKVRA